MKQGYIQALENKTEGCNFCTGGNPRECETIMRETVGVVFGKEIVAESYIFGNLLTTEFHAGESGIDSRIPINFCPFCGRRL